MALVAVVGLLAVLAPTAHAASCFPVTAEFVLTGMSNPNGNAVNHEIGVCLPQFQVNLTASCLLTMTAKYVGNAAISLFSAGANSGLAAIPRASDPTDSITEYINNRIGYYYLAPTRCPVQYQTPVKGQTLLGSDIQMAIQKTLGVGNNVLSAVAFTQEGMTITWMTAGPYANTLVYTAIAKKGGPTTPDFTPYAGQPSNFCPLLDINAAPDLDTNPLNGIVDENTITLVGRVPRPIPNKSNAWVCAVAPAGGVVSVVATVSSAAAVVYPYTAKSPNTYVPCTAGKYMYKLGAINLANDARTDSCNSCFRGSYSNSAATLCTECPSGQHQPSTGQRSCLPCQYGYAPYDGAVRCMNCYYSRPYCSEGFSSDTTKFTCNNNRLPDGYSPTPGYTVVQPAQDPSNLPVVAQYSPFFAHCDVTAGNALMAFNVSAECGVDWYMLGDLGQNGSMCSQNAEANSIKAYYTAPNILASLKSPGLSNNGVLTGVFGNLGTAGMDMNVVAISYTRGIIPIEVQMPTTFTLVLPPSGWAYLGGGDNGMGRNAELKGVNKDPCPSGTIKQQLNGDGKDDPGEVPSTLLASYCVPCGVGSYCTGGDPSDPQNCPAGTFGPTIGAKSQQSCADCPVGTYQDQAGAYECRVCSANSFSGTPGATTCAACGDGYQISTTGSNFCDACNPGWFRDSAVSESCQKCPSGHMSGTGKG
eukprot:jgi/Chrzof1/10619/Cz05g05130.t1